MSEIDQQFIEYVVKSLVGKPEAVRVDRRVDEKGVLLELTVDPEDLGRVIGKRGATAQSMRTLLRALGTKNDARYNLKIVDNGEPGLAAGTASDDAPAKSDDATTVANDVVEDVPVEAAEPEPEASAEPGSAATAPEEATSDRLAQARQELADLDDLDV